MVIYILLKSYENGEPNFVLPVNYLKLKINKLNKTFNFQNFLNLNI